MAHSYIPHQCPAPTLRPTYLHVGVQGFVHTPSMSRPHFGSHLPPRRCPRIRPLLKKLMSWYRFFWFWNSTSDEYVVVNKILEKMVCWWCWYVGVFLWQNILHLKNFCSQSIITKKVILWKLIMVAYYCFSKTGLVHRYMYIAHYKISLMDFE